MMIAAQLKLAAVEGPSILQLPSAEFELTIQAQTSELAFAAEASAVGQTIRMIHSGVYGRVRTSPLQRGDCVTLAYGSDVRLELRVDIIASSRNWASVSRPDRNLAH